MNIVLVDSNWKKFLPVSFTRPVSHLRLGIFKIYEKWERLLGFPSTSVSEDYLNPKFFKEFEGGAIIINSKFLPTKDLLEAILTLENGEMLSAGGGWIAIKSDVGFSNSSFEGLVPKIFKGEIKSIEHWSDLYKVNKEELAQDFAILTNGRVSQPISDTNTVIGPRERVFLEEGAYMEGCTVNVNDGPVYIGRNAEVMEGAIIRGGLSVGEETKIKLGAKIYGPTTIGPKCRVGGEVKNSLIQGYSNKSHDGYLGNSVMGEWVNLGADTNCSNLKNTFSIAKVWDYEDQTLATSSEAFIGSCFGDFSKTGINTMLNTATVIGVNANVFGEGFPPKFIPSFSWGKSDTYQFEKAWAVNKNIAEMAGEELLEIDKSILKAIHDHPIETFKDVS